MPSRPLIFGKITRTGLFLPPDLACTQQIAKFKPPGSKLEQPEISSINSRKDDCRIVAEGWCCRFERVQDMLFLYEPLIPFRQTIHISRFNGIGNIAPYDAVRPFDKF